MRSLFNKLLLGELSIWGEFDSANCRLSSVVERYVANVEAVGSIPTACSIHFGCARA